MGGGDLNTKKSWHPNTIKNQERVWKAEQQDAAEKRKLAELQREIHDERNREELKGIAKKSGLINDPDDKKLEWMYKGPQQLVNREDYLLGKSIDKTYEQLDAIEKDQAAGITVPKNHVEHECIPFSIRQYKGVTSTEQVDLARKLMEDPLMAIKQKEIESRQKILENPVKLKELHRLLKQDKGISSKKVKKNKDKRQKKSKKSKKKKEKSKSSDSKSDESENDEKDLDKILAAKYKKIQSNMDTGANEDLTLDKLLSMKYQKLSKELDKMSRKKKKPQKESENEESSDGRQHERSNSFDDERKPRPVANQDKRMQMGNRNDREDRSDNQRFPNSQRGRYNMQQPRNFQPPNYRPRDDRGYIQGRDNHRVQDNRNRQNFEDNSRNNRRSRSRSRSRDRSRNDFNPNTYAKHESNDRKYRDRSLSNERRFDKRGEKIRSRSREEKRLDTRKPDSRETKRRSPSREEKMPNSKNAEKIHSKSTKSESKSSGKAQKKKHHSSSSESCDSSDDSSSSNDGYTPPHKTHVENSDEEAHKKKKSFGLVTASGQQLELNKKHEVKLYKTEEIKAHQASMKASWSRPERQTLTEAEIEKRRSEMMQNADWREKERSQNVKRYREEEKKQKDSEDSKGFDRNFVNKQFQHAANNETVESRIKSNRNNIQRSGREMNTNFARR